MRRLLTPANVLATLCLFVVLGGEAGAGRLLSGKDIKNGSLTGADLKDGSVRLADLAPDARRRPEPGPSGATGAAGPAGPAGPQGADGPAAIPAVPRDLDWTPLEPRDGWFRLPEYEGATLPVPQAAKDARGYVHLRGGFFRVGHSDAVTTLLPAQLRPATARILVLAGTDGPIRARIEVDGRVRLLDDEGPFALALIDGAEFWAGDPAAPG